MSKFKVGDIIHANNIDYLRTLKDNSVDSVVTDPPYGISFMNKKWDYDVPSVELWQEVYRVLKPGGHMLVACGTRTQHRMAINIEDAGFEIRDIVAWVYGCLDTATDILTQDGWKGLNDISTDDFIFSFKDGKIIKNSVKHVFEYAVDNLPMQYIHNKHTSQLLTPNHKMLIQELNREVVEGHRETEWEKKFKYVDAIRRPNTYNLPLAGKYDGSNSIGKDFAELIGWVVAEGHYQKDTNAVNLYQSNINMEHVKRINWLLGRLNIKHSKYERERTYKDRDYTEYQWYISGEWADKIKEVMPTKGLHWGLLELPYREKLRLVDGLVKGDGSENNGKWKAFYQKGRDQLDIFQALLHTIDKVGLINDNKQTVSVRHKPTTQIQRKHKKEEVRYTGKVWCIETEVGNFMARRDNKIFITGNSGFPKSHDISKAIDKSMGAEREVVGKSDNARPNSKKENNLYEAGTVGKDFDITAPSSDEAKQWQGWGTALKPSMELWTLARKPLIGTVAQNILEYGVGGINIDATRIPFGDETDSRVGTDIKRGDSLKYKYHGIDFEVLKRYENDEDYVWSENLSLSKINVDNINEFLDGINMVGYQFQFDLTQYEEIIIDTHLKHIIPVVDTFKNNLDSSSMFGVSGKGVQMYKNDGRFPANFIHNGSDEVVSLFPDSNGGTGETKVYESYENDIHFNASKNVIRNSYADSGSASRFFYVAKASQEERNFGLYDFEEKFTASAEFRPNHMGKALEGESGNPYGRWQPKKNIHPTVKPIDLMRYLVRMITPPNGICLDPYLGSGTTAIACEMEKFNYIGIELDEQYIEIAKARVDAVKDYEATLDTKTIIKESIKEDKEKELGIQNIFDFM